MRLGLVLLVCLLAVAGCGGDSGRAPAPAAGAAASATPFPIPIPTPARLRPRIPALDARRLDAGAVGVIGFDLRGAVAPSRLMVNNEQTLEGVRWSGWGSATTTGRARVDTVVCDPSCGEGRLQRSRATIVLSQPRRCGRRRFYTTGRMTYLDLDSGRALAPSVFLWQPHCPAGGAPASSTRAREGAAGK